MMQARVKGETQWYRPDRDAVNSFNIWLRQAITEVSKDVPESEVQALYDFAGELGKLSADCAAGSLSEEQLRERLRWLMMEASGTQLGYVSCRREIAVKFLSVMFCNYLKWCKEIMPDSKPAELKP